MSMRDVRYVTTATFASGFCVVLVQLLSAGLAALPLGWLLGTSQVGLALAKYGPYMLLNFLALLLSMWVFLRYGHVGPSPAAESARPVGAAETYRVSASYDG